MTTVFFQKWEATGNDFLFVDSLSQSLDPQALSIEQVAEACHRTTGFGADGVVFYSPNESGPTEMTVVNSDGSLGGMCGNALRCLAEILFRQTGRATHRVRLAGRTVTLYASPHQHPLVHMGPAQPLGGLPLFSDHPALNPIVKRRGHLLSFGNPHYVVPVDTLPQEWQELGQALQEPAHRVLGTGGINVGFLELKPNSEGVQTLRVFERGAGPTKSCGSGACAASAVLEGVYGTPPPHRLHLTGGVLTIAREAEHFTLSGPARLEYDGTWNIET